MECNKVNIIQYNIKLDFKLIFVFKIDLFLEKKNEIKDFFHFLIFQFSKFLKFFECSRISSRMMIRHETSIPQEQRFRL